MTNTRFPQPFLNPENNDSIMLPRMEYVSETFPSMSGSYGPPKHMIPVFFFSFSSRTTTNFKALIKCVPPSNFPFKILAWLFSSKPHINVHYKHVLSKINKQNLNMPSHSSEQAHRTCFSSQAERFRHQVREVLAPFRT